MFRGLFGLLHVHLSRVASCSRSPVFTSHLANGVRRSRNSWFPLNQPLTIIVQEKVISLPRLRSLFFLLVRVPMPTLMNIKTPVKCNKVARITVLEHDL